MALALCSTIVVTANATESATVHVYGPGGPAPAMKEAAQVFNARHDGADVRITAGPTSKWLDSAKGNADLVYSGAENMMTGFAAALPGAFDLKEVEPLYLRPSAILVRPGNPKHIQGFRDLLKPGTRVLVVAGAGQVGLWEDVAGRTGEVEVVRAFRRNLDQPEAANSAAARDRWTQDAGIDAWLIWNIWQVSNADLADLVPIEEPFRIYRDTGVVLTGRGKESAQARAFVAFLKSEDGRQIFHKWGWRGG